MIPPEAPGRCGSGNPELLSSPGPTPVESVERSLVGSKAQWLSLDWAALELSLLCKALRHSGLVPASQVHHGSQAVTVDLSSPREPKWDNRAGGRPEARRGGQSEGSLCEATPLWGQAD